MLPIADDHWLTLKRAFSVKPCKLRIPKIDDPKIEDLMEGISGKDVSRECRADHEVMVVPSTA